MRDETRGIEKAIFKIYNSLWLDNENMKYRDLNKSFKDAVKKYSTDIQIVNNNDITRKIRDWYNEKTDAIVSLNINKKDFSNCVRACLKSSNK